MEHDKQQEARMKARKELMKLKIDIERKKVRDVTRRVMNQYRQAIKSMSRK